jgi:alkylation response protein AidB-like acyl-CoA dehydrogenase
MTTGIDLGYSTVEDELRGSVRAMLADRCPPAKVLAGVERDEPFDRPLWKTVATDMGLAGLAVPVDLGGAGAGWREVGVVLEELGRALAPVPYLTSAGVATAALLACDRTDEAHHADQAGLLGAVAAGSLVAVLAVPWSANPHDPPPVLVRAVGDRLTGTVPTVADGLAADVFLVPTEDGLFAVDATAAGVNRSPTGSLDLTRRLAAVELDGAPGRRLTDPVTGQVAVTRGLVAGAALHTAEQVGVAQWCLDSTVEYVRTRYQFGRPVGSFQAVKHRLADVWVELTQARATARYAVGVLGEDDPDLPVAIAVAQATCSVASVRAAEECIQLHGGIGFTWEHPAHLYLKRAKSSAIALGTPDRHRASLVGLVDLPA